VENPSNQSLKISQLPLRAENLELAAKNKNKIK
jgi:hypothetical protein